MALELQPELTQNPPLLDELINAAKIVHQTTKICQSVQENAKNAENVGFFCIFFEGGGGETLLHLAWERTVNLIVP
jgi:hypothetical protein